MVINCVVYQYSNRQNSNAENGTSFFRFPKDLRKRKAWINAVNRAHWLPNENSRICSTHFVDGWHIVRDSSVVRRHYILLLEPSDVRAQYIRITADLPHQLWVGTFPRFVAIGFY